MGDIAFNIAKDVNLNKVVTLDILKTVDVNVNNPDQLATAEADAEAFGIQALAETDAYTYVTEFEAFSYAESTAALDLIHGGCDCDLDGAIDILGNTSPLVLGADLDGDVAPDTVLISFNPDGGDPTIPDVDDANGFGELDIFPPPGGGVGDQPLPIDGVLSITDLNLVQTDEDPFLTPEGVLEAEYEIAEGGGDWVVDFGTRTIDLCAEEVAAGECDPLDAPAPVTANLTLTVTEGTEFLVEYLNADDPFDGAVELEFEAFPEGSSAFFTFGGEDYAVDRFTFIADSLEDVEIGDYAFEAETGDFT